MQVQEIEIEKLIPYARNSRTHSDEQVAQIAASIKEFGFTSPILIDGENGIIAGHGRLAAARKLNMTKIPAIELSHLTKTQKKALIIADNKLALNAGWDNNLLALEFEDLKDDGFDLDLTGFLESELDALNKSLEQNDDAEDIEPTEVPEDLINAAWQKWAGEIHEQISVLIKTGHAFMGITTGYAEEKFLKAKYDKKEYPRHCSLAFHSHQIICSADIRSTLDGLSCIAAGEIKPERLRFILGNNMDAKKLASGSLAFSGSRMPLDFPASLAKSLYNEFAQQGKILDPCHGWGGRLTGFLLSNAATYTGIDASPDTSKGVHKIGETFSKYAAEKKFDLHCMPFEKFSAKENTYDFALTSPPYFDVEKYIGGEQSHTTHNNYESWRDGFYTTLLKNVYIFLKKGGVFALQVGSQSYPLLDDGKKIGQSIGYKILEVRSTDMINSQTKTEEEKSEVILILQK